VSLTDPDSRAMAAYTKVGVGYNIQIAVDAKHKMIVEQAVSNDVLDMGLLQRTAEPARTILEVEKIDVVADKGYFRTEDIASCEEAGLTPHVPRPQRGPAVKNGFFRKDEFRYDAEQNAYICPAGQALTPIREGKLRALKKVDYGNAKACRACALRPRCTKDVRAVSRLENEDALDRMAERLKARPEILERRREIVEHPFGSIKQWMNQGAFLMRRLEKVRAEFSLTALVYNLRRALNILGMEKLMAAVAARKRLKSRQDGCKGCFRAFLKAQARSGAALGKKWQIPAKTPTTPGHLQSAGVSTQSVRNLHAGNALDRKGFFRCKY
jgi:IS5 family transposase